MGIYDIYLSISLSVCLSIYEDGSHHPQHLHPQQLTRLPHSRGALKLLNSETENCVLVPGLVCAARPSFDTVSVLTKPSAGLPWLGSYQILSAHQPQQPCPGCRCWASPLPGVWASTSQLNRQRGPPPGPSGHLSTVHSVSTQKSQGQGCEKPELLFTPHSALEQAAWVQTSSPG